MKMDERKRQIIENLTKKIRNDFKLEIPFTKSIDQFLFELDGRLEYESSDVFLWSKLYFPEKIWDKKFVIVLNQERTRQEQEYEIAYQIGNLFLHTNYIYVQKKTLNVIYNLQSHESREKAACFADNLIMPREEFIREVRSVSKDNSVNMQTVAEKFDVSWDRAAARGIELKLIKGLF